jgi:hypothetical protein
MELPPSPSTDAERAAQIARQAMSDLSFGSETLSSPTFRNAVHIAGITSYARTLNDTKALRDLKANEDYQAEEVQVDFLPKWFDLLVCISPSSVCCIH